MKFLILSLMLFSACGFGPFKKDNEPKPNITKEEKLNKVREGLGFYCSKIKQAYLDQDGMITHCDSALFASLAGVACEGIDITPFEKESNPGQMCRDWECTCTGYSKDMNAGVMLNQTIHPNAGLIHRITKFLVDNNYQMCFRSDYPNEDDYIGKCLMPPITYGRWLDLEERFASGQFLHPTKDDTALTEFFKKVGFEAHLAIVGIHTEQQIYSAISDISKNELKDQAARQPNNALFVASSALYESGDMEHAADLWLSQCPLNRLPNSHDDRCTDYLYQRDEESTLSNSDQLNWKPCPQFPKVEHPGIDCAFAGWVILQGK